MISHCVTMIFGRLYTDDIAPAFSKSSSSALLLLSDLLVVAISSI